METLDCVVVGAGVVGLALARRLAQTGREVLILESEDRFGTGISSRNSEVIHAGLHYPAGSLKSRLCIEGRRALYTYCEGHHIPHARCGKLLVATSEGQVPELHRIFTHATAEGVEDLRLLEGPETRAMEPKLHAVAALHSPSTGIVDSHALMAALLAEAEAAGATLVLHCPVLGGRVKAGLLEVEVGGTEAGHYQVRSLYNAAGLGAWNLAAALGGLGAGRLPPLHFAKGSYFSCQASAPFSRLIYPLPEIAGLGVHLTLDLAGKARFGPDVEWVETLDFGVDPSRSENFYAEIRKYWPDLPDDALVPDYAGIRPKLQGPGEAARDFLLLGPAEHGIPGLVHLLGIESPGLTACLALAEAAVGLQR